MGPGASLRHGVTEIRERQRPVTSAGPDHRSVRPDQPANRERLLLTFARHVDRRVAGAHCAGLKLSGPIPVDDVPDYLDPPGMRVAVSAAKYSRKRNGAFAHIRVRNINWPERRCRTLPRGSLSAGNHVGSESTPVADTCVGGLVKYCQDASRPPVQAPCKAYLQKTLLTKDSDTVFGTCRLDASPSHANRLR